MSDGVGFKKTRRDSSHWLVLMGICFLRSVLPASSLIYLFFDIGYGQVLKSCRLVAGDMASKISGYFFRQLTEMIVVFKQPQGQDGFESFGTGKIRCQPYLLEGRMITSLL